MRIVFGSTQRSPGSEQELDSSAWSSEPDFDCGYVTVQGRVFDGADHYAVVHLGDGSVEVHVRHDDLTDWPVGTRWARVTTVPPLGPDPRLGGAINVLQRDVIYAEPLTKEAMLAAYAGNPRVSVLDWDDYQPPNAKHQPGRWVSDAAWAAHRAARPLRSWREWTEGLHPDEVDPSGLVRQQQVNKRFLRPKGTRTYYASSTSGPNIHGAQFGTVLETSPSGSTNETATSVNQNGDTCFASTTAAGEPDSAAWPTTGTYRHQLDIISVGADLTFGLLDQGNGVGHFGRVNSGATADLETFAQDESAFSTSGLHLATVTDPAWTSGSATDRFEVLIAAIRVVGHGGQDITRQVDESDDYADGPWAAAAQQNAALFFGSTF